MTEKEKKFLSDVSTSVQQMYDTEQLYASTNLQNTHYQRAIEGYTF